MGCWGLSSPPFPEVRAEVAGLAEDRTAALDECQAPGGKGGVKTKPGQTKLLLRRRHWPDLRKETHSIWKHSRAALLGHLGSSLSGPEQGWDSLALLPCADRRTLISVLRRAALSGDQSFWVRSIVTGLQQKLGTGV